VRSFNAGDRGRLNRLWAKRGEFRWYTAFQRDPPVADSIFSRAALLPYFATRHRRQERLRIRRFRFNGNGGGYGHFEYRLEREALDLSAASRLYDGKGAVTCYTNPRALAVWSMGTV
jgi:hypothetical protein